ncbi:hypothetical protein AOQ84DRAFT_303400, partial [Glonium stellatum]
LRDRIKNWAMKRVIEDMGSLSKLRPEDFMRFRSYLSRVVRLSDVDRDRRENIPPQLLSKKRAGAVCLEALLVDHIYTNIINCPFFVLKDQQLSLQALVHQLQELSWSDFAQATRKESHLWRSKMVRLLSSPPAGNQGGQAEGRGYAERRAAICSNLTIAFYEGPAWRLMKTVDNEEGKRSLDELKSIVQYAGEMSSQLWSRKTFFRVLGLPELKNRPFSVTSKEMEAHALNLLDDEEDDNCNGMLVHVVVHSLVFGYGSSDGIDHEKPGVWVKATLWLNEETE